MKYDDIEIFKTNDLSHSFDIIINHPDLKYIWKISFQQLALCPGINKIWPENRRNVPVIHLSLGILHEVSAVTFNHLHSDGEYFDIYFSSEIIGYSIGFNLIDYTVAIFSNNNVRLTRLPIGVL